MAVAVGEPTGPGRPGALPITGARRVGAKHGGRAPIQGCASTASPSGGTTRFAPWQHPGQTCNRPVGAASRGAKTRQPVVDAGCPGSIGTMQ